MTAHDTAHTCEIITGSPSIATPWGVMTWAQVLTQLSSDLNLEALNKTQPCLAAIASPGHPSGIPDATWIQAVSWKSDLFFACDSSMRWQLVAQSHSIAALDFLWARNHLLNSINEGSVTLRDMNLAVANNLEIELGSSLDHWPPNLPQRNRQAIDQANRICQLVRLALTHSQAVASRSNDNQRIQILNDLDECARNVLCAAVSAP